MEKQRIEDEMCGMKTTGHESRECAAGETMPEREKAYLHWLYQAAGIGARGFLRALTPFGTAEEIYRQLLSGQLAKRIAPRYGKKVTQMSEFSKTYDVETAYGKMRERGIQFLTEREAAFPQRLRKIPDAPFALYCVGRLPEERKWTVAVIGARECTEYGKFMAEEFGAALARAGVQVVSGLARGIDGVSQKSALQAGGYSLGVLGCGVDICYPEENRELYETLAKAGGFCSEYPPGTPPKAVFFPPRNRLISGFADGLLVIEAKEKSGTLITVDMALEQGREVYALPGRATDPLSGGCNRLIRQGAGLVCTPEELLEELYGVSGASGAGVQTKLVFLEGIQGELLELLDCNPLPAEEIQRRYAEKHGAQIALPLLFRELLELCAAGFAGQVGGSYFMKILKN
ncbi:MAG: DNA-processing protein DprA [Bacteroidales bacterium]|nr:DNA-processing protein DprA [Bacteroidales bacterium]MCM1415130.1 DNA-processing protein DprA [bacterium]MCM1423034.1 DNA-processing protein DprA [bacterium]